MENNNYKLDTLLIHAGVEPDPTTGAIMTPIYQTSTYVQDAPGKHKGYEYARTQNPTKILKKRLLEIQLSKAREGEKLQKILLDKLKDIEVLVVEAKKILPVLIKEYQTKIENKFKEALIAIDDDRLKQEFLIFIQKMDIDEELNRITSHIDEVRRLLKTDGAIGKKLDFMMQELNREANTLGSKSISPKTSQISVDLKVLIEQMREQIQNIE